MRISSFITALALVVTGAVVVGCHRGARDERRQSASDRPDRDEPLRPVARDPVAGTALKVGQPMPEIEARAIDGEAVTTASLRGSPTLIVLFSTTCGACRAELDHLDGRLAGPRKRGLDTLAIGRDDSTEGLTSFGRARKQGFDFLADPDRAIYNRFASVRVPRTYLFDAGGVLVHQTMDFTPERADGVIRQAAALVAKGSAVEREPEDHAEGEAEGEDQGG